MPETTIRLSKVLEIIAAAMISHNYFFDYKNYTAGWSGGCAGIGW